MVVPSSKRSCSAPEALYNLSTKSTSLRTRCSTASASSFFLGYLSCSWRTGIAWHGTQPPLSGKNYLENRVLLLEFGLSCVHAHIGMSLFLHEYSSESRLHPFDRLPHNKHIFFSFASILSKQESLW